MKISKNTETVERAVEGEIKSVVVTTYTTIDIGEDDIIRQFGVQKDELLDISYVGDDGDCYIGPSNPIRIKLKKVEKIK